MKIKYKNEKVESLCTSIKVAKKELNSPDAESLLRTIEYINQAVSLEDIRLYRKFNLHKLRGDLEGLYSIDIRGRRSQYRLIIKPLNKDEGIYEDFDLIKNSKEVELVKVEEVSKHYEK